MLKVLSFLTRRADLGPAAFGEYWRTVHKAHAMTLVDAGFIRGYVQNHRIDGARGEDLPGLPLIADGLPELWVDDADALARLVASREYLEGAGPDEANFVAPPVLAAVAQERVLAGGETPAGAVKLMLVVRRDPALPADEFAAGWLAEPDLSPLAAETALRVSRHAAVGDDATFAGVECTWWPDEAALAAAWRRRNGAAGDGVVERGTLRGIVVREEVVVAPPRGFLRGRPTADESRLS